MPTNQFRIRLVGDPLELEHVRLTDFIAQLRSVQEVLFQIDQLISDSPNPTTYYRIVDLSHSSPATVLLEAVPYERDTDFSQAIVSRFFGGLQELQKGTAPADFNRQLIESYKGIAKPLRHHVTRLVFVRDNMEVEVTRAIEYNADIVLGPEVSGEGTLKGALEAISVHGGYRFTIYPVVGPKKVTCEFPSDLLPVALGAFGRCVRVTGKTRRRKIDDFPNTVDVVKLDVLPNERELPSILDLRGIARAATGRESSEQFVRRIRDASE